MEIFPISIFQFRDNGMLKDSEQKYLEKNNAKSSQIILAFGVFYKQ